MTPTTRAKVFISCGQRTPDERHIADEIKAHLVSQGFEPYVATRQQTLQGLRENIFAELRSSEYFLFIDFKRDQFANSSEYRGSLFTNQELAIASFLDFGNRLIAIQEHGVLSPDGILGIVQANCPTFTDRATVVEILKTMVKSAGWQPNWKNQLRITREEDQYEDALNIQVQRKGRYYHLSVHNLNPYQHARNCYAYLEKIQRVVNKEIIPVEVVELKWRGYVFPNAIILADSTRHIDAFYIFHDKPHEVLFNMFTDYSLMTRSVRNPDDLDLTYLVVSDNFEPARVTVRLHLGNTLDDIRVKVVEANDGAISS